MIYCHNIYTKSSLKARWCYVLKKAHNAKSLDDLFKFESHTNGYYNLIICVICMHTKKAHIKLIDFYTHREKKNVN